MKSINETNFNEEVIESAIPVLVDFWGPWCGPCNRLTPLLEALAKKNEGKVNFVKVNVDENNGLASKYNIGAIPAILMFKGNQVVNTLIGLQSEENIQAAIDSL